MYNHSESGTFLKTLRLNIIGRIGKCGTTAASIFKRGYKMRNDCFAYNTRNGLCTALTVCSCDGCKFYKTADEARLAREQAHEMLKKKDSYLYFRDKYNLRQK